MAAALSAAGCTAVLPTMSLAAPARPQDSGAAEVPAAAPKEAGKDMSGGADAAADAAAPKDGVKRETVELVTTTDAEGKTVVLKPRPSAGGAYGELIDRYAARHGVSAALAHAVVGIESGYRADARGRAGEVGLMQIKPATARMLGYSGSVAGLFKPETNIRYGMKYLAMAQKLGDGSTCGTILKYNAGHAAKRMNKVSAAYCAKVKRTIADS